LVSKMPRRTDVCGSPRLLGGPSVDRRRGMVSLDDLPVRGETRAEAREWNRPWEQVASNQQAAEAFVDGMSSRPAKLVSEEEWTSLECGRRVVWQRLQDELGGEWQLEWAYP
jgi:hypothetical protein